MKSRTVKGTGNEMREQSAKILAAELERHRYWRVESIYSVPESDGAPPTWVVCLRHRVNTPVVRRIIGDPEQATCLIASLNAEGRQYCDLSLSDDEMRRAIWQLNYELSEAYD